MKSKYLFLLLLTFFCFERVFPEVKVGADLLFEEDQYRALLVNKRIAIVTNHSATNHNFQTTFDLLKQHQGSYRLVCVFTPEHGYYGDAYAHESIADRELDGVPIYGLIGERRRPTPEMLEKIDLLVFDIQDIGSRSYSFISTLFYCMEEAKKFNIPCLVLDRPNPMGGLIVDGPNIEEKWRSFLGYVNVPYCHGMTIGELAHFFNEEYKIGCKLKVIPMKGWKRKMTFFETGLPWVPTSPQIPESDTPFFYPTTGLLGHCSMVNIGIGYTLPFKLIGAPWIDADRLAKALNQQKLPGVMFHPFYFRPFFGKFKLENCQGVRIVITDPERFLPITTQYTMMGILKSLYTKQFKEAIACVVKDKNKLDVFNKLNGSEKILHILTKERYITWKLREICEKSRQEFLPIRKKYLLYN